MNVQTKLFVINIFFSLFAGLFVLDLQLDVTSWKEPSSTRKSPSFSIYMDKDLVNFYNFLQSRGN